MQKLSKFTLPEPLVNRKSVRRAYRVFHDMPGVAPTAKLLTAPNGSAKAEHTLAHGLFVTMLYLAPHTLSKLMNLCPYSTPGCRYGCLFTAGRAAQYARINIARTMRVLFMVQHPLEFSIVLAHEITLMHKRLGNKLGVRLNGTSDIPWERVAPWLFTMFPDIQFYDYTKWPVGSRVIPANYDLTQSVSEREEELVPTERYAVVFRTKVFPATYGGLPVVNGDDTDARFMEPKGVVAALSAKGLMVDDETGMVKAA